MQDQGRKRSIKTNFLNLFRRILANPFFERQLLPWTIDQPITGLSFKIVPSHYLYKRGSLREVNREGIQYLLDISDMVDWYVYYGFLNVAHKKLYQMCDSDSVVLDIGTNIGSVLLNLSNNAKDGLVIGFEPYPTNYSRCKQNLLLNDAENVEVLNLGLGDCITEHRLTIVDPFNLGMTRFDPSNTSGISVPVTTLDQFVSEKKLQKIDLIKIDVEGFEYKVINGGEKTLTKYQPKLFIELDDKNLRYQNSSAYCLIKLLKGLGYTIQNANDDSMVGLDSDFTNCHFDIICTPE